jgi:hypothetical protein
MSTRWRKKTDSSWFTRKGTVVRQSKVNFVYVKWDDRKSIDHWPPEALEKIDADSH